MQENFQFNLPFSNALVVKLLARNNIIKGILKIHFVLTLILRVPSNTRGIWNLVIDDRSYVNFSQTKKS